MSHVRFALAGSLAVAAFALSLTLAALSLALAAGPREQDWNRVNEAIESGKPKTAIERLEPIVQQAMNEQNYDEAIKAIALKLSLEADIQGGKPEEKITRMEAEIEKAPAEMKPTMEAILANWYWQFFQQNRWRFTERTQITSPSGDDLLTWDLPRILAEIDRHFTAALANSDRLQRIPVTQFDELLEKGNTPDAYRPTLFDVLAHNALEFYSSGEQAGSKAFDAFELTADSPIFGSAADFIQWQPVTSDEQSLTLQAIRLYQQLLKFHQEDEDRSAFLDTDLHRLIFGNNQASGEDKTTRYRSALRRFAEEHAGHPISSRALHQLASSFQQEDDLAEAHRIASEGQRRHPDSIGGRRCFNLIQQIEAKSLQVTTERVWNEPNPTIDVTYRNITSIHFRLVPLDFGQLVRSGQWGLNDPFKQDSQKRLLAVQPVRSWSVELPATDDFKERVESFPCPDDLKPGPYALIASHREDFGEEDNVISLTEVWRSDLALVMRNHFGAGRIDGFVLDARSGEPISGAVIRSWIQDDRGAFSELQPKRTDNQGRFELRGNERQRYVVLASNGDHSLSSSNLWRVARGSRERSSQRTLFFTDRAIYRPGQPIHFKGLCISLQPQRDDYNAIANQDVVVAFLDTNRQEIERLRLRSNDYGSFNGTFTAPRDRLTGRMSLAIVEGPNGRTDISVEEYKRPKFQVEINPPAEPAKLDSEVQVVGEATAYTGASINGASVQWRVVREVRYPDWWFWRRWWIPPVQEESQEIAHGTALTDGSGKFTIAFNAKPDPSVSPEAEPVFRFSIYADVTDATGETRSASRVIQLGYAAVSASLSADDWLSSRQPVQIRVRTQSLDGEPRSARGSVEVFGLKQPDKVHRPPLSHRYQTFLANAPQEADSSNPNSWPIDQSAHREDFETDASGTTTISANLPAGAYRVKLVSSDRFGKEVTAELPLTVIDPEADELGIKIPELYVSQSDSVEPGEDYVAVWGSGYETARVFVEVEHRGRLLQQYWTEPGVTQTVIRQKVDEGMRGGFHVRTTMVRENRAYTQSRFVEVPWTNKQLSLRWEHMVSKLEPAAKEVWTAIITGPEAEPAVAEMVATLYDASLEAFRQHSWPSLAGVFRRDQASVQTLFENQLVYLRNLLHSWTVEQKDGSLSYWQLPSSLVDRPWFGPRMLSGGMGGMGGGMMGGVGDAMMMNMEMEGAAPAANAAATRDKGLSRQSGVSIEGDGIDRGQPQPDLSQVSARKNLNETAFFFPHLLSDEDGKFKLEFTMPEALTEWKFLGFAHDRQLRSGLLTGTTVTAKDLMVEPNPPRFLREGDIVEFTVKVSNQSPTRQSGSVQLSLSDARTGDSVDEAIGNTDRERTFDIAAGEATTFAWRLSIPDGLGFLTYRAVGSTGRLSDGEEGLLPVLSRRVLVTESLPLPIRGAKTKEFRFEPLISSADSDSLRHHSLTLQMVSNPSWYAVMALPYLMEFPHECSEQVFNRLYANSLARHLAQSDPKIERVFAQWRATPALDSPLEKNEELKGVMLEETPWVRQAQSESQSRRQVGLLFENNRLDQETSRALFQLSQMQTENGTWPWFPGGPSNDYITLYITTGFGRMRHLGVNIDPSLAIKSLTRLDQWMKERYQEIEPAQRKENHLSAIVALYLYGRSFFLDDQPIAAEHRDAWDYWIAQAKSHWLDLPSRQSEAHVAMALKRVGQAAAAVQITDSLKERAVVDEEMGMYWRDLEFSWWWYRAPIETQAMMIEVFDEVADDQQAVEDCKAWLLKQKQTQDWKTTKATADAIYALLLRGSNLLASNELVEVTLGGLSVPAQDVEAGTGFFEHRWHGNEIKPSFGNIELKKSDEGVAWGSLHWQYFQDIAKVSPHEATPLTLTKQLFVKKYSPQGPVLDPVEGPVEVGDELVVRLVLRTDRDMEYVHLKDYRGSGTEPVNVLSQYRFQDGLGYYESTRDTASHFFIDYLPKGTYVFEYSARVQLRGNYQTGFANIECMYAPEFNSHSKSFELQVQ